MKTNQVNANLALFNNRCYIFCALEIRRVADPEVDQTVDIQVVSILLVDIPELILKGQIGHVKVITAFAWYFLQNPERLANP